MDWFCCFFFKANVLHDVWFLTANIKFTNELTQMHNFILECCVSLRNIRHAVEPLQVFPAEVL